MEFLYLLLSLSLSYCFLTTFYYYYQYFFWWWVHWCIPDSPSVCCVPEDDLEHQILLPTSLKSCSYRPGLWGSGDLTQGLLCARQAALCKPSHRPCPSPIFVVCLLGLSWGIFHMWCPEPALVVAVFTESFKQGRFMRAQVGPVSWHFLHTPTDAFYQSYMPIVSTCEIRCPPGIFSLGDNWLTLCFLTMYWNRSEAQPVLTVWGDGVTSSVPLESELHGGWACEVALGSRNSKGDVLNVDKSLWKFRQVQFFMELNIIAGIF